MKSKLLLSAQILFIAGGAVAQEVGIGTTAPAVRLDIQAPAGYTNDLLRVMKGTATFFIIKNSGNVGIGTATPVRMLHVGGNNNGSFFLDGQMAEFDINQDHITLKYTLSGTRYPYIEWRNNGGVRGLYFGWGLPGSYVEMRLENGNALAIMGGNVGIGTAVPTQKLDVNGQIRIRGGSPGTGKILQSDANGVGMWVNPSAISDTDWTVSGNNMYSAVSGNVGVGTAAPGAKLDVAGHIWQTGTGQSVFMGEGAGANDNLNTNRNVFVGYRAGHSNTTGRYNMASGCRALYWNTTGWYNTAIGYRAFYSNTTGWYNTAIGSYALYLNTTGHGNTAGGHYALYSNTAGGSNTGMGRYALYHNTTGNNNTAIGYSALNSNTTGSYRTGVGYSANSVGSNYSNSTGLGYNADPTASNRIHIGNTSVSWIGGQVTWSTYSDARIKKEVRENVKGLDFILRLRPVSYRLDIDRQQQLLYGEVDTNTWKGKYAIEKIRFSGFIAQEVAAAAEAAGYDFSGVVRPGTENETGRDLYSLRYAEFVVPLVKAVQEQQAEITTLRAEKESMQKEMATIQARLAALESALRTR